jgi:hypothetical protein
VSVAINTAPRELLKYTWIFYGAPLWDAPRLTYPWCNSLGCAMQLQHFGSCRRPSFLPHLAAPQSRTLANRATTSARLALSSPSASPPPLALASRSICSPRARSAASTRARSAALTLLADHQEEERDH